MTDHKLTDEEIIRALECCTNCICSHAETDTVCVLTEIPFCKNYLMKRSLDLVNRQKAEIESLKKLLDSKCDRCISRDRAEAITEFAERLKGQCSDETTDNTNNPCVRVLYDAEEAIDDLVKEMTEENEKT